MTLSQTYDVVVQMKYRGNMDIEQGWACSQGTYPWFMEHCQVHSSKQWRHCDLVIRLTGYQ